MSDAAVRVKEEFEERGAGVKPINGRIRRLRQQSVDLPVKISPQRARLMTEFYRAEPVEEMDSAIRQARAFNHLVRHKTLSLQPGELIVGEKGTAPKETPTFPEICTHSMEDLKLLDSREKNPYLVDEETRRLYREEVIPYWRGKTMRERVFEAMSPAWLEAFRAGVFTEFMEQRAPGHTVLGGKLYRQGLEDIKEDIHAARERLESGDPEREKKLGELSGMEIAADALIGYARRYAEKLEAAARKEEDEDRATELREMAEICRRVPAKAPRNFWEALQYYWFVHVGVITELNPWDSLCPGRLDQHLYPFYKKDLEEGRLTKERAKELLQAFWIKFHNQPAPPKVGVTAEESNTYSDFAKINVGGLTPEGEDGVNELTYLVLDVVEEMRLIQPNFMVQLSEKNPDRYLERALEIVRTGFGQPAIFNADGIVKQLLRQGKSLTDARRGGCSGCVETGAFGRESYILTGYFNMPKVLELTLNEGIDPQSGKRIGKKTGDPRKFESFKELFSAYEEQLSYFIDLKIEGNKVIQKLYGDDLPAPLLSLFIEDCVENATDYNAGGARYDSSYIQGVGLGTMSDSLAALKDNVYDREEMEMGELLAALKEDFAGREELLEKLKESPKYGNDDDYADELMKRVFRAYFEAIDGRPNGRGGRYRINLLPTTVHVYFGSVCGATPDGREAGKALSEGISPVQGADEKGPTAVFRSVAKMDHSKTGGTLLNQKLTPDLLRGEREIRKLAQAIRAYFDLGAHHVQFNVVSADLLREAKKKPEEYKNLVVRVAGYSDYFVNLTDELQEEIIRRTEQTQY